ncbi:MAG: type IV toxin-antitoxin system AbiEi family antitoxin domain-containing protein [Actinobacteria bacterium]|nr:type IV toxin-antitoxin system AbiEi family antitoxin domain-containing protein [Actinomycetota bacterium]
MRRASENGGAITRAEALALGMTETTLRRRVDAGWMERAASGVYVLPWVRDRWFGTLAAAIHKLGAVASHEAAAQLHEMRGVRRGRVVVSVPVRRSNRFVGAQVHQSTDLTPDQLMVVEELAVTTPARTIIDLAAVVPRSQLERIISFAVADGILDLERLIDLFHRLARRGKPGVRNLRVVLSGLAGTSTPESELEIRFLGLIRKAGLPDPVSQFRAPWLRSFDGRVDFAYVDKSVVIELDGKRWHSAPESFIRDRERMNLAQVAGWQLLTFTWEHITQQPKYVVATVRKALCDSF